MFPKTLGSRNFFFKTGLEYTQVKSHDEYSKEKKSILTTESAKMAKSKRNISIYTLVIQICLAKPNCLINMMSSPNIFLAYVTGKLIISLVPFISFTPFHHKITSSYSLLDFLTSLLYTKKNKIFLFWNNLQALVSRCYSKKSTIADHPRRKFCTTAEPISRYVKQLRQSWSIQT